MSATAGSGRMLWRTWLVWVTAGETLGFCVPALVAALTAGRPATVALPSLLLAGAVEGALLGGAQVHVLRRMLPGLSWRRWVAATSGAVVLAWLVGLLPATLWDVAAGWPIPVLVSLALGAGVVLLLPIGTAQWLVLRHHAAGVAWWVPVTALAWLAGLAVFVLVAPPLWRDGQPPVLVAAFGVLGGVMMAFTVAAVTGIGVVRLARRSRPETPRIRSVAPGFSDVNWLAQAGRGRHRAGHQCHGPRRRVERTHDPGVFAR